jgi:hypothetical protein
MPARRDTPLTIEQQIILLPTLPTAELKAQFVELFGEASRTYVRSHLIRRIAWRLQSLAEGGLSERARQRAAALAEDSEARLAAPPGVTIPKPPPQRARHRRTFQRELAPGTVLSRPYRGRLFQVKVLAEGFEYDGYVYGSLSAVAKAITGTHWNGPKFFGLGTPWDESDAPSEVGEPEPGDVKPDAAEPEVEAGAEAGDAQPEAGGPENAPEPPAAERRSEAPGIQTSDPPPAVAEPKMSDAPPEVTSP